MFSSIISAITEMIRQIFIGTPAGDGVTAVPSWISVVISTITTHPLLLFVVLMPFIGVGITLLRRLFKSKA